ncbi:MAG: site-specific integrase [Bacteroidota bacterium]|nr:site-specific integrase [Bacteroidota bacterium]
MATGSLVFFPNRKKISKRDNKIPMYMRIIWNRKKAEAKLLLEFNDNELLKWNSFTMRFDERNNPVNEKLQKLESKFKEILLKYAESPLAVTSNDLRNELLQMNQEKHETILNYCWKYYNSSVIPNYNLSSGTKKNYQKAIRHLDRYLVFENKEKLKLSDLNIALVNSFWDYLLSTYPKINKTGMTEVSASANIKRLRTILDRAYNEELISRNPFKTLKLKNKSPKKDKLNSRDIQLLYQVNLQDQSNLEKVRDIFLFSLYTGLAYKDAMVLKRSQLQEWQDEEIFLNLPRVKTDIDTKQFLVSYAKEIIEKYKEAPDVIRSGGLIPRMSNQQLNLRLKIIAERAGININLTMHIARHSFRQLLSEAGINEIAVVKTMMGHSLNNDIDNVYYNVSEKSLLAAKKQFENYLKQILNNSSN